VPICLALTAIPISCNQGIRRALMQYAEKEVMKRGFWRALTEIGFIVFLFYANLLMGEYTRTLMHRDRGLVFALEDIFTEANFAIAIIAAMIGYLIFDFLRRKF
jgi:hypothetical protein